MILPGTLVQKPDDNHSVASADTGDIAQKEKEVLMLTYTAEERGYLPSNVESQTALGNAYSTTVDADSCYIGTVVKQPRLCLPAVMTMKGAHQV